MPRMIFLNLPVTDLKRATAFYEAIGATRNPQFSDNTASCMVFSEAIYVMLTTHDKFRHFTPKRSSARPKLRAGSPIPARSTTTASCTAAASRIRTAICGA